ncbi:hypothetical protein PIROE2DRAFT_12589 [Piromyces sp. E2]|nr:hypothetical protein PIROE2DRAFT_12589 [Piromyces sp. E2]|eukprot:OUM61387.1 hypothetical protein PIROE2DRAFT_12589 [Piromyces sp. E2]
MNSKNIQKNQNHEPLIYLEYTMINEKEYFIRTSMNKDDINKTNYSDALHLPEVWSLSHYLVFLKGNNLYSVNEPLPLDKQLELLNISTTNVHHYKDISSDYEKTLWCWCHRLKQAMESNTKHSTYHHTSPPFNENHYGSIYLSFLLQTIALFQQQKLKRFQLIFSY